MKYIYYAFAVSSALVFCFQFFLYKDSDVNYKIAILSIMFSALCVAATKIDEED